MDNQFEQLKKAILAEMASGEHCEESFTEVKNSKKIADLVAVLKKYSPLMGDKNFPSEKETVDIINRYSNELYGMGVFVCINGSTDLTNSPLRDVFLIGGSVMDVTASDTVLRRITLIGGSKLILRAKKFSMFSVILRGGSKCEVVERDENARVKTRKAK